jgi:uncharacterized protein (TIGR03067 family)
MRSAALLFVALIPLGVIGALTLLSVAVADEDGPPAALDDAASFSGVWVNVYTEHDGKRETPDSRHVFVGNRYFRINGDRIAEDGTFVIDATGPVKKIDYRCERGEYVGLVWRAVYELKGNTFRHFGPWGTNNWHNRPAKLAAKTDATTFLRVMKREWRPATMAARTKATCIVAEIDARNRLDEPAPNALFAADPVRAAEATVADDTRGAGPAITNSQWLLIAPAALDPWPTALSRLQPGAGVLGVSRNGIAGLLSLDKLGQTAFPPRLV